MPHRISATPAVRLEPQREPPGEVGDRLVDLARRHPVPADALDLGPERRHRLPGVRGVRPQDHPEGTRVEAGVEVAVDGVGQALVVADGGAEPAGQRRRRRG